MNKNNQAQIQFLQKENKELKSENLMVNLLILFSIRIYNGLFK